MTATPLKVAAASVDDGKTSSRPLATNVDLSVLREASSSVVPYLAFGLSRLGKTGVAGISLLLFSCMIFFSGILPARQQMVLQQARLESARTEVDDQRPGSMSASPKQQAAGFVQSLPTVRDVPNVMATVITIAAASQLELERGSYEFVSADTDAISQYRMSLPVTGSYAAVRKFIEDVLASVPAISLENMRFERDAVSNRVVAAELTFSILLGGA